MKRYLTIILGLSIFLNSQLYGNTGLRYQLGMQYLKQKDYDRAIEQFERILTTASQNGEVYKVLGEIYILKENYYKALTYFQNAIRINPEDLQAHLELAEVFTRMSYYQDAIKAYQHILKLDSTNIKARIGLADVYSWDKKYTEAINEYKKVLTSHPHDVEALSGLARIAAWNNKFDNAIAYYQQAIKFDSVNINLHKCLGEVLSWQGNYNAAIKQYQKVLKMDPAFVEAYRGLGQVYSWKGQYKQAISVYKKAIQLQPKDVSNYLELAQVYRWNKKYDKAKQMYQIALKLEPSNITIKDKIRSLQYEAPIWYAKLLGQLKNLLLVFVALILIYYIRRSQRVIGNLSWFRIVFLRVMPALAFAIVIVIFSSPLLAASYYKEVAMITEIIEIVSILLLTFSFITLLWILRFGHQEDKEVILAIGAHPDDLELGCGGTILRYREEGGTVIGLILSNGENGVCDGDFKQRVIEAKNGAKILNLNQLFILNFPDTHFNNYLTEIKQVIEQMIKRFKPDVILTHSPNDLHSDHRTVYEATKEAARGPQSVLMYENTNTPSSFTPDFFVDISGTIIEKIKALKKHKTQAKKAYTAPSVVKSMAKFRGSQVKVDYAEAFKVLKFVKNHSKATYKFNSIKLLPASVQVRT